MLQFNEIDNGKSFDWGLASKDYAKFRDIYPDEFYEKLVELGICVQGQKVLDLGTGTGVLPRNMYKYGARFIGADISEKQIEQARDLSAKNNLHIDYIVASAETIKFPNNTFDVITACQCFWYFNKEVALPKIHDALKKKGRLVVLIMNWLPYEDNIAKGSEDLVLKYNPSWTGGGIKRSQIQKDLEFPASAKGLFEVKNAITYDIKVPFTRETWHGRMKACRGIGASSLPSEVINAWEKEHVAYMETLPKAFEILHYVTILDLQAI